VLDDTGQPLDLSPQIQFRVLTLLCCAKYVQGTESKPLKIKLIKITDQNSVPTPKKALYFSIIRIGYCCIGGTGISVGIATDYGLDGSGSNPGGDEIFRPSRPAVGPTQQPVK